MLHMYTIIENFVITYYCYYILIKVAVIFYLSCWICILRFEWRCYNYVTSSNIIQTTDKIPYELFLNASEIVCMLEKVKSFVPSTITLTCVSRNNRQILSISTGTNIVHGWAITWRRWDWDSLSTAHTNILTLILLKFSCLWTV